MICRPVSDSTGRVRLPVAFIEANRISYGQPITVTVSSECTRHTFLCAASVSTSSSTDFQFDPSLLCEPAPARATLLVAQQQLVASVTPVTTKVITAASVKVQVPGQLLQSAVLAAKLQQRLVQKGCTLYLSCGVYCQVVDISPVAVQGTVYRVVPSTAVQLTAESQLGNSSSDAVTAAATAGQGGSASSTPAAASKSTGSNSRSRPRSSKAGSSSSTSKKKASSTQDSDRKSASKPSSSSQRSSKQEEAEDSEEAPAAGSGSMFDLLNALGDD